MLIIASPKIFFLTDCCLFTTFLEKNGKPLEELGNETDMIIFLNTKIYPPIFFFDWCEFQLV